MPSIKLIKSLSFVVILSLLLASCKEESLVITKATAETTAVDSTLSSVEDIEAFIKPYQESLNKQMDSVITYSPSAMHKNDFKLNTPISNMFAHITIEQGNPIFKSRTGKSIDMALLNHGGIRAPLPQGDITTRNAYEIMPFENQIVVAALDQNRMQQLVDYLVEKQRAHPIEGLKLELDKNGTLRNASVNNKPLTDYDTVYVATNDYLFNGGDDMAFFKDAPVTDIDYKLRNAIIDYFKKTDTLKFERDDRFTIAN